MELVTCPKLNAKEFGQQNTENKGKKIRDKREREREPVSMYIISVRRREKQGWTNSPDTILELPIGLSNKSTTVLNDYTTA